MQSTNPVFARNDSFNGRSGSTYTSGASTGYGSPSTWLTGAPGQGTPGRETVRPGTSYDDRPMTIDSVVQKSAVTLGVLILAAAATWVYLGGVSEDNIAMFGGLAMGGALLGFVLAMVNSFKAIISPPLVLAYAAAEGVFVGAFSSLLEQQLPGIVISAVAGTVMAFAGTLTAYKVLNIQVTDKFRRGVMAAVLGMVGVMLLDLVMGLFNFDFLNLNSGFTGLLFSALGVVLGVFMLILDFDFVEQGIKAGAPERESWRAAFGLTVTLIWLYVMMLRLLAILRGE